VTINFTSGGSYSLRAGGPSGGGNHGGGMPAPDVDYFLYDPHGNVVMLVDSSGEELRSYSYDAFGNQLNENSNDDNFFRYSGQYYDEETGTYYLRARNYSASLGRFTQEDPIGDGLNWYVYCYNNPIRFMDFTGLKPTVKAAAAMSDHIYDYEKNPKKAGIQVCGWKLVNFIEEGSLKLGIYIPEGDNKYNPSEYVLAFRGTPFEFSFDAASAWKNNFAAALTNMSHDASAAILYSYEHNKKHANKEITMVGHSKGGGEAIMAAVLTGNDAITFNAANFNFDLYGVYDTGKSTIDNYYVKGEILSTVINPASIGNTHWLESPTQPSDYTTVYPIPVVLKNHSMDEVKKSLDGVRNEPPNAFSTNGNLVLFDS